MSFTIVFRNFCFDVETQVLHARTGDCSVNGMEGEHLCAVVLTVLQNIHGDTDFIVKFTILTLRQQKILCKYSAPII